MCVSGQVQVRIKGRGLRLLRLRMVQRTALGQCQYDFFLSLTCLGRTLYENKGHIKRRHTDPSFYPLQTLSPIPQRHLVSGPGGRRPPGKRPFSNRPPEMSDHRWLAGVITRPLCAEVHPGQTGVGSLRRHPFLPGPQSLPYSTSPGPGSPPRKPG